MNQAVRFTFVADSRNRTAVASLVGALEDLVETGDVAIRFARPAEAPRLDYGSSHSTVDVLCMSAMTETARSTADLLAQVAAAGRRESSVEDPPFISICGGPHATADPRGVLEAGFDYCCVGEGEEVIRDLARKLGMGDGGAADLARGGREAGDGLVGDSYTGRVLQAALPADLNAYPALPGRVTFRGYIEIARGCRWACAYCQNPEIFGHVERFRSPEAVARTVALYSARGMKDIRLLAPNAFSYGSLTPRAPDCGALEDLLSRVKSAAGDGRIFFGSFPSEVRPDYVTEDAVRVLKRYVTNTRIVIGGQTGSQRVLDRIHRHHTVEDIVRASGIVASFGFQPLVDLMVGFPFEEAEDRQAVFALIESLRPVGARFTMHFFMPLPGTPLAGSLPRFLSEAERRHIDGLAERGLVRGRWRRQEEFARRWSAERSQTSPRE